MRRAPLIIAAIAVLILVIALPLGKEIQHQRHIPQNRDEMNEVFDQDVIAFLLVDNTPHVLVEWNGQLIWENLELKLRRTGYRWNWDGDWTVISPATGAGSAQPVEAEGRTAIVGQILNPSIVSVRIVTTDQVIEEPVEAPGYAVLLPDGVSSTDIVSISLLNSEGQAVWASTD